MVATSGSSTDALLKQIAQPGIAGPLPMNMLSAPPEPAMSSGGPVAPKVAPSTSMPGWGGIMDIYRQSGALSPDQYQSEADKLLAQVHTANQGAIGGIQQNMQKRDAILSNPLPHPALPHLQSMPQAPDTRMKNPLQVFQSSASILGLLGSAFTRRPLVTAMNAASAAIKGYAEGDKDAAERAHKSWKDSLEQAIQQNQTELDQYNAILQDTKLSMEERNAQLAGLAASNNDQVMIAGLSSGESQMAFNVLDGRQKAAGSLTQMLVQAQQFESQQAMERARIAETQRHNLAVEGGASGALDEPTVDMLAQAFVGGDKSVLNGLGYGRGGMAARHQVLQRAGQLLAAGGGNIPGNRAQYAADAKALGNIATFVSRTEISMATLQNNIEILKDYMKPGVAGELPVINKWIQSGRRATGDPDVAAFDTAIRTVAREYGRIMSGAASNAQLPVAASADANEMLNSNMNAESIMSTLNVMNRDVAGTIAAADSKTQELIDKINGIGKGPNDQDFSEGDIVEQGGHHFKFTNGDWVPQD